MSTSASVQSTVITPLTTPFTATGAVDMPAARELFRFTAATTGRLMIAGTTGEFPALDRVERRRLLELALETAGSQGVMAHTGAADTHTAVALTRDAVAAGATRIAALTPYYFTADEGELLDHFRRVREAAGDTDLYAYLFPERSGITVGPEPFGRLAADCGFAGVKLSGSPSTQVAAYRAALPADSTVYSGNDALLTTVLDEGGAGVISGCSGALPEPFLELAAAHRAGAGAGELARLQGRVDRVVALLGPSVGRIKRALVARGLPAGTARMTVGHPDERTAAEIEKLVADLAC
ncbi:dihydrodipicolinate synthase family protein [Streptomyces sp. NBC_01445]|uniref:dihydrodipicolinate synthase family protein n=1 Tax=Streptomyces sp. NBC_01445 TaxID=2903869 RepID=UPI002DD82884|nr:dihydrodipicolinate synthase family protein [Streptomyces sp. NBC_01445]WSE03676.1 dihydrodipicolinate synthase family protein [Streptomyces sp. NBC_01445]